MSLQKSFMLLNLTFEEQFDEIKQGLVQWSSALPLRVWPGDVTHTELPLGGSTIDSQRKRCVRAQDHISDPSHALSLICLGVYYMDNRWRGHFVFWTWGTYRQDWSWIKRKGRWRMPLMLI